MHGDYRKSVIVYQSMSLCQSSGSARRVLPLDIGVHTSRVYLHFEVRAWGSTLEQLCHLTAKKMLTPLHQR